MEICDVALLIAKAALDKKAENLKVLDVRNISSLADYFVFTNGSSDRQVKAISDSIQRTLREEAKLKPTGIEGSESSRWILMDYGDVVVHIFQDEVREYFDLDTLWSEAPQLEIPSDYYVSAPVSTKDKVQIS